MRFIFFYLLVYVIAKYSLNYLLACMVFLVEMLLLFVVGSVRLIVVRESSLALQPKVGSDKTGFGIFLLFHSFVLSIL